MLWRQGWKWTFDTLNIDGEARAWYHGVGGGEGLLKLLSLILIMLAGLMAIALFVRWYAALCYRLLVRDQSAVLDEILLTGEVPAHWRRRGLERLALRAKGPFGRFLQRRIMRLYARKMRGMISFARSNRRISPEEAGEVARELRETAEDWLKCRDLEELIGG